MIRRDPLVRLPQSTQSVLLVLQRRPGRSLRLIPYRLSLPLVQLSRSPRWILLDQLNRLRQLHPLVLLVQLRPLVRLVPPALLLRPRQSRPLDQPRQSLRLFQPVQLIQSDLLHRRVPLDRLVQSLLLHPLVLRVQWALSRPRFRLRRQVLRVR